MLINTKKLLENNLKDNLIRFSTRFYIGWVLFIALLTLVPGKVLPQIDWNFWSLDKAIHFSIFSIMVFLGCISFKITLGSKGVIKPILISLLIAVSYGTLIEYAQTFIPDRGFDYADLTANIAGSGIGILLFLFFNTKITK